MTSIINSEKCKGRDGELLPRHDFPFPPDASLHVCTIPLSKKMHSKSLDDLEGDENGGKWQLPVIVIPKHYTVCLKPIFKSLTFEGCVAIECDVPYETSLITLNMVGLSIDKIIWIDEHSEHHEPFEFTLKGIDERMNIIFKPSLPSGNGVLLINFNGRLNDAHLNGFYYLNNKGQHNALTKFSPTEARKCFPCFDEPGLKAEFSMSFIIPRTMSIISNTAIKVTYPHRSDNDLHNVEFEKTPKMSTCHLAFVIGQFNLIEVRIHRNISCQIYTTPIFNTEFGKSTFESCKRCLTFYEKYFGIEFPLRKIGIFAEATMTDDVTGAWGLMHIKKGQLYLTEDDNEKCVEYRVRMLRQFSHVLCHHWIGNLVTMKWWTNLWLYKSLGILMEFMSIDALEPTSQIWLSFVTDICMKALEIDAHSTAHMLQVFVNNQSDVKEALDRALYKKGASILQMLKTYIGSAHFQKGLQNFLRKFAYGNATAGAFWETMEEVSGKSIRRLMLSWTKQAGFPLVRILSSRFENKCRIFSLRQESFCDLSAITQKPNNNNLWIIPISISVGSNPKKVAKEVLMDKHTTSVKICGIGERDWFKLNPGHSGFYRVKYPSDMLGPFLQGIRFKVLPPLDRLGLLNDTFAFARSGLSTCVDVLTFLEAFVEEDNLFVWMQIDEIIGRLDLLFQCSDCHRKLLSFAKALYKTIYAKVEWDKKVGESEADTKLREIVITRMLILHQEECLEEGLQRFKYMMIDEEFPPGNRAVLYKSGMYGGNYTTCHQVIHRFKLTTSMEEKSQILESFGLCTNEVVLREILEFAFSNEVSHHDTMVVIKAVTATVVGRGVAWEYFKERFAILIHRYPLGSDFLVELIKTLTRNFNTENMVLDISEFSTSHHFPGIEKAIPHILDNIHVSIAWMKRERVTVLDYLGGYD